MKGTVAVIGSGVAGIVSAWELSKAGWSVTLFEKDARVGGHTHTVVVEDGPDAGTPVDTGFIVLNEKTYPGLHGFLAELGVKWRWSEMSFGYHDAGSGLQYAGTTISGLFAQRENLLSPSFWSVVAGIVRFGRSASADLETGALDALTLGEYLRSRGFSRAFIDHYAAPMGGAIWSTGLGEMMDFPARTFARFFKNHGLLSLVDRPRWQTVVGGSHSYVKAFLARFPGRVERGAGVESLRRLPGGGVEVRAHGREPERFDRAVVACHADEALALLADPSDAEKRVLGAWHYLDNRTVLHTDESFMPPNRRAWAAWNYKREMGEDGSSGVSVTYDMNRLQGLRSSRRYLVTLNPRREPRPGSILRDLNYKHPAYGFSAIRSQAELPSLSGVRDTWFAGSYHGYGFHEDAVQSALTVARSFELDTVEA